MCFEEGVEAGAGAPGTSDGRLARDFEQQDQSHAFEGVVTLGNSVDRF